MTMTPIQQAASDAALRWEDYLPQQINLAGHLLNERLGKARTDRATFAATAHHAIAAFVQTMRSLGED